VLAQGDVVEIEASAVRLNPDSGELALYTSDDFSNADDIIRYVQWGTDSHGRAATAVAGGSDWPHGEPERLLVQGGSESWSKCLVEASSPMHHSSTRQL
jgi:hypothetical protein